MKIQSFLFLLFFLWFLQSMAQDRGSTGIEAQTSADKMYRASYALLIGNSTYTKDPWVPLQGVRQDLTAVQNVLEAHGFQVFLKTDLNKTALETVINSFIAQYGQTPDNRLLFYYAGHGSTTTNLATQREAAWLIPVDSKNPIENNFEALFEKAYPVSTLTQMAEEHLSVNHALFLFDSCFSGALFNTRSRPQVKVMGPDTEKPLRYFITSGSKDEQVPDDSVFRRLFVRALSSSEADFNKDGDVTEEELALFIAAGVSTNLNNHPQFGTLLGSDLDRGDFIFSLAEEHRAKVNITKVGDNPTKIISFMGTHPSYVKIPEGELRVSMGLNGLNSVFETPENNKKERISINAFKMSRFEVTNYQYCTFLNQMEKHSEEGIAWLDLKDRDCKIVYHNGQYLPKPGMADYPVVEVTWYGAKAYCKWAGGRLPTETEWEYAAKAGSRFSYAGSNNANEVAWSKENSGGDLHPVGELKANYFDLHDMSGNVMEWTQDTWQLQNQGDSINHPWQSKDDEKKVLRGGNFALSAKRSSVTERTAARPSKSDASIGFRVCKSI